MSQRETVRGLRHALAQPLSSILGETQLCLMDGARLPQEVVDSLRQIERQAHKMKALLIGTETEAPQQD